VGVRRAIYVLGLAATFALLGVWSGRLVGSSGAGAHAWWFAGAALGASLGSAFAPARAKDPGPRQRE